MLVLFKKMVTSLILLSLVTILLFGFSIMVHGADESMPRDCPFSTLGGTSLCPQDTLAIVIHHISAYHALLNIPIHSSFTAPIISLLFVVWTMLTVAIDPRVFIPSLSIGHLQDTPPSSSSPGRKIARWLSLLKHSPST